MRKGESTRVGLDEPERGSAGDAGLTAMFDAAWDSLGDGEREEIRRDREAWMNAYPGRSVI